jgi:hypothetical protein
MRAFQTLFVHPKHEWTTNLTSSVGTYLQLRERQLIGDPSCVINNRIPLLPPRVTGIRFWLVGAIRKQKLLRFTKNKTTSNLRSGLGNVSITKCRPFVINIRARAFQAVTALRNKYKYGICDLSPKWRSRKEVKKQTLRLNYTFASTMPCIRAETA